MGLSFDILIFDCLLKAPQPVTGLFFVLFCFIVFYFLNKCVLFGNDCMFHYIVLRGNPLPQSHNELLFS